jgi:hypothetical protein
MVSFYMVNKRFKLRKRLKSKRVSDIQYLVEKKLQDIFLPLKMRVPKVESESYVDLH